MWKGIIEKLFSVEISKAKIAGYNLGFNEAKIVRNKELKSNELFEMKEMVGKVVITFSNEWEDMIVGKVLRVEFITQAQQPVLVIKDCLTKKEIMTFGKVYEFDLGTLHGLLKLNPYERWNLSTPDAMVSWSKPKRNNEITDAQEFVNKLTCVSFD